MKTILVLLFLANTHLSVSQTVEEWTRQKQTRINYLIQQIIANKAYILSAEQGYKIATGGLRFIQGIKDADLQLHVNVRDSLQRINSNIRSLAIISDIMILQTLINKIATTAIRLIKESGQFTSAEVEYCVGLLENLLRLCGKDIDELILVITAGSLAMKDDERIMRIQKIYSMMQDKASFISSFHDEINILSMQRLTEQVEIKVSKRLNSIQ